MLFRSPAPARAVAEQQARRAIESLGLPMLKGANYSSSIGDSRMVNVQVTPVVDGFTLDGSNLWVQVAKQGVFGLNGFGAHLEKATTYPIAGARDVANRSQLRKWAAFGPANVTPQTEPIVYADPSAVSPTTRKRDGRLMVQSQLAEITVTQAAHSLQQQWFPGGEILFLPAWNFTEIGRAHV